MKNIMVLLTALLLGTLIANNSAVAEAKSLDELLNQLKKDRSSEQSVNKAREQEFLRDKNRQEQLVRQAKAEANAKNAETQKLQAQFDSNAREIERLKQSLLDKSGDEQELIAVVRQFSGDFRTVVSSSLVSAELPGRTDFLDEVAESEALPSVEVMEQLWFEMLQEMRSTGEVKTFPASLINTNGETVNTIVTRVGTFTAVADGKFLNYNEVGGLTELPRQPAGNYLALAEEIQSVESGVVSMVVDPTRGSLLNQLVDSPGLRERIDQGGVIGYLIIGLGLGALIFAIFRFVYLGIVNAKVSKQLTNLKEADDSNPLGRVLAVFHKNLGADPESLELKLDEAILREVPKLEQGHSIIKLLAGVATLAGLLGTVVGMISTFQVITLFGTSDPKLMAGGISQALVTTVLGIVAAIPLLFAHSVVVARSKRVIQILEQQSIGLIARVQEAQRKRAANNRPAQSTR